METNLLIANLTTLLEDDQRPKISPHCISQFGNFLQSILEDCFKNFITGEYTLQEARNEINYETEELATLLVVTEYKSNFNVFIKTVVKKYVKVIETLYSDIFTILDEYWEGYDDEENRGLLTIDDIDAREFSDKIVLNFISNLVKIGKEG